MTKTNRALLGVMLTGTTLLAGCGGSHGGTAPPTATITFSTPQAMPGMEMPTPASSAPPAAPNPATGGTRVEISDFAFTPAALTVRVGTTVVWTNHDDEPHTVVAKDGSFHSPALATDASYSFTFTAPGTFDYVCSIHPMMTATVVVTR